MRYESFPRKVSNWLSDGFKYLRREFGNWAFLIIAVAIALLYKPVKTLLDKGSTIVLYIIGAIVILLIFRWFIRSILDKILK